MVSALRGGGNTQILLAEMETNLIFLNSQVTVVQKHLAHTLLAPEPPGETFTIFFSLVILFFNTVFLTYDDESSSLKKYFKTFRHVLRCQVFVQKVGVFVLFNICIGL